MKNYLAFGIVSAAIAVAAPASAQSLLPFPGLGPTSASTMAFRAEALRTDAFEIESSRVALQRSRDPRVRAYARQTIEDHQATTDALLPEGYSLNVAGNVVADEKGGQFGSIGGILSAPFTVPVNILGRTFEGKSLIDNEPGTPGKRVALDPERQQMLVQLDQSRGRGFNSTYSSQQAVAHRKAVALYTGYAQNGDLEQGRAFANQALPTLQQHLYQAERLDERYGNTEPAF